MTCLLFGVGAHKPIETSKWPRRLIIGATRNHLLARRPQHNGVLVLRRIRSLNVAQWRIRLDSALVAQVLKRHLVLGGARAVQPALAEGERAKVLVDGVQQRLGRRQTQRNVLQVKVAHVMRHVHVVVHDATAGRAERLDGVELVLLHARRFATLDNGHSFAGVDACVGEVNNEQVMVKIEYLLKQYLYNSRYGLIECPFKFRMLFTWYVLPSSSTSYDSITS